MRGANGLAYLVTEHRKGAVPRENGSALFWERPIAKKSMKLHLGALGISRTILPARCISYKMKEDTTRLAKSLDKATTKMVK